MLYISAEPLNRPLQIAVEQYRSRPALQNGKPVPVKVNVEVMFRRY